MRLNWLGTTAIALMIGTGPALAQSAADQPHQRNEKSRAQSPAAQGEMGHPAGRAGERTTGHAGEAAGTRQPRQGEVSSPVERSKQAKEPVGRASRESDRQGEVQPRDERTPSTARKEQKGREARQSADQQRTREGQKNERAQDINRRSETRQTTGQARAHEGQNGEQVREKENKRSGKTGQATGQERAHQGQNSEHQGQNSEQAQGNKRPSETSQSQQESDRGKERANQRTESSTQRGERAGQTAQQRQSENAGQPTDRTHRRSEINEDQRRKIADQLRHERTTTNQNVNIRVNIGQRLPPRVDVHRLPSDVVQIAPQYRNYDYTVIDHRIAIVNPQSREVVEYLDEGPDYGRSASYGHDRIVFSDQERARWRDILSRSSSTVGSTASSSSSSGGGSTCLSLRPVPEEMVRDHPELRSYRYLAIGDEAVLVDPQQHKIVQVID